MKNHTRAFILKSKEPTPLESPPGENEAYDRRQQLWIHQPTGIPLVLHVISTNSPQSTRLGETVFTETREGTDQSEIIAAPSSLASPYGETIMTKTQEGNDQCEITNALSFGHTVKSASREGTDQSEITVSPTNQHHSP